MFSKKELIIFDMDGTLIDSAPSLAFALNHVLRKLNKKSFREDIIRTWTGNGVEILIKRALAGSKSYENFIVDEELFLHAKNLFINFHSNNLNIKTTLYPHVSNTLAKLKENGYSLALATNKPIQFVGTILEHFDIKEHFDLYYGSGSVENRKPHPQILLEICKELHTETGQSVMVGDSSNDLLAANAANMDTIAVTYGYNQGLDLKDFTPTLLCNSFEDITQPFGIKG